MPLVLFCCLLAVFYLRSEGRLACSSLRCICGCPHHKRARIPTVLVLLVQVPYCFSLSSGGLFLSILFLILATVLQYFFSFRGVVPVIFSAYFYAFFANSLHCSVSTFP